MVAFYNQGDQDIYQGGQHYIPQEQYRLGYKPPITGEDQTTTSGTGVGIPYTGAFTNSGGGGGGGGINEDDTRSYIPLSQRNKNIGFLTNLSNQAKDSWSGIKDSTVGRGFQKALSPLMHLINLRNPFHPDAQNYNPLLLNQQDLALRSADLEGFGWTQDMAGRFAGSADPDDPNYNPLYGQNLVSGFGTNDLTQMLQKRLNYLQNQDYESDTKEDKIRIIKEKLATSQQGDIDAANLASVQDQAAAEQAAKTTGPVTGQGGQIASADVKDIGGGFHEYKDAGTAAKYEGSFKDGGRIGLQDGGSDYGQFDRRQAHNIAAGPEAMNVGGGGGEGGQGGGNNTGGNVPIVDNPVGPNYPAVGPMFNTALVNKQIAYNNFMKQFEEDENKNVTTDTNAVVPTSGYEVLGGDLGNQRIEEKAAADIWKEYNTGGRVGFFQGALADTAEGQAMSPGTSATGEFRGGDGGQGDGNNFTSTDSSTIPIKQIAMNQIMKKGAAQGGVLGSVMGNIPQIMALKGIYNLFNKQRNDPNIFEEDVIYGQDLRYGGLAGLL